MPAFHEILFPLDVALGSRGGPERKTEIVTTGSGREERNAAGPTHGGAGTRAMA